MQVSLLLDGVESTYKVISEVCVLSVTPGPDIGVENLITEKIDFT